MTRMKIAVNSVEYKCWHEAGHATVCLHLGGDVEFIEFLVNDPRGHAFARCIPKAGTERSVACGGFAAEFFLFNNDHIEQTLDEKAISQVCLGNATNDGLDFVGRDLRSYVDGFTEVETREFVTHAIGYNGYGGVVPIINQHFSVMQELVRELRDAKRVDGKRVKELLRLGNPR